MLPYVGTDGGKISVESEQVKVCIKCKSCFVFYAGSLYDVTDDIDLDAWKDSEAILQEATGPGGEC